MDRLDVTGLRCQPEGSRGDVEEPRGLAEVQPRLDPVMGRLMDWNAMMRAQRGDALARPAIAIASHQSVPVQDAGDE
ncbi:MAG TPA: hypothetical protein VF852_02985, partial [Pseudolabrys sp.]